MGRYNVYVDVTVHVTKAIEVETANEEDAALAALELIKMDASYRLLDFDGNEIHVEDSDIAVDEVLPASEEATSIRAAAVRLCRKAATYSIFENRPSLEEIAKKLHVGDDAIALARKAYHIRDTGLALDKEWNRAAEDIQEGKRV
jgi:hypothetical protein